MRNVSAARHWVSEDTFFEKIVVWHNFTPLDATLADFQLVQPFLSCDRIPWDTGSPGIGRLSIPGSGLDLSQPCRVHLGDTYSWLHWLGSLRHSEPVLELCLAI